ncbi:hypothetical protein GCM10010193_33160 [Kitasatospora atroaurantiaca]
MPGRRPGNVALGTLADQTRYGVGVTDPAPAEHGDEVNGGALSGCFCERLEYRCGIGRLERLYDARGVREARRDSE